MATKVVMPVARRVTQPTEGVAKSPARTRRRDGTSGRRSHDDNFVVGQSMLTKRVLAVALLQHLALLHSKRN
jgi:hypothetical protein